VRFVAHLDLPKSIEAYYQETGRAGRDGLPAEAWMVYGLQDIVMMRRMIEGSEADETRKRIEHHKLNALVGMAEITTCRRQALLRYLGESAPDHCGNCDTCLHPVKTWDGTIAAQKALSCVYRTEQRFGSGYVIDVLLGKETERMRSLGHQNLSTFGIGKELDGQQWRSVIRQLVARNFLSVDVEGFGSMRLTESSRAVLKGEKKIYLREEKKAPKKSKKSRAVRRGHAISGSMPEGDKALWEALRKQRTELAGEQGVPPYVIFHDKTFMEMVERRPRTLDEMGQIIGVGEKKLELYGRDFLDIIKRHQEGKRG